MQQVLPADLATALADPDWRASVAWPVSLAEANAICTAQVRDALAFTRGLDDAQLRDAAILALPVVLAYARAIVLAAIAVQRAASQHRQIIGEAAEFEYLKTGEGPLPVRTEPILPPAHMSFLYARRVARMRSWTPLLHMPRAMLKPKAVAVGHNPLLRAAAQVKRGGIGFQHAESLLQAARRTQGSAPDVRPFARELSKHLAPADLVEPYRERALRLIEAVAAAHLVRAAQDLYGLRQVKLPMRVWSGSGGLYAPRAIGLEVLRRGGHVRRFDHGTPREFVATAEITELLELSVSSEFTLATQEAAAICRCELAGFRLASKSVAISGATGDPVFRRIPRHRTANRSSGRLRVVYAPTQLLGFRQLVPALPPDPVHLDWQMRVAAFLNSLPVDFICQAHPEGLFAKRAHPLERVVPTRRGNFAAQLAEADVFVFDYPTTTALWEAACSDARIVYLDMGAGRMTGEIARLFAQRATILPVIHQEDHRMVFDEAALRDAVLAASGRSDPTALRRLLAGDA